MNYLSLTDKIFNLTVLLNSKISKCCLFHCNTHVNANDIIMVFSPNKQKTYLKDNDDVIWRMELQQKHMLLCNVVKCTFGKDS